MNSNSRKFGLFCAIAAGVAFADIQARAGAAPESDQTVGYFPTYEETELINSGFADYDRGPNIPLRGPDLDRWGATGGVWPYEVQAGSLSRVQRFLQPIDYIMQPLTPGEGLAVQGPTANSWAQLGGSFPFLTRTYHTERSTFSDIFGKESTQYSPFFFDLLSVQAIVMYVEGDGPGFEEADLDEGVIGALGLDLRAGWALTDRTSLIVAGTVYFVFSDDSEVQCYLDAGALSSFASINLQDQWGSWDVRLYDDLIPFSSRRLFFDETTSGEIQQVGHYWVGIPDSNDQANYFDSHNHYLLNTLGATAGTFIGDSLRFLIGIARMDTWVMDDFDEHSNSEYLSAGLFYDGYDLWMAPSLTYTAHTEDFDNLQNTLMLNVVAPISPNITFNGGAGYSWGDTFDGVNWMLSLNHQLTDRFRHSLSYASGYQDVLIGEDFIGNRFDYGASYQLGGRCFLTGYTGWFDGEGDREDALVVGGSFNMAIGDYTWLRALVGYQEFENSVPDQSGTTWLYSLTLSRRLAERLNAELTFEYNDNEVGEYSESLVMLRLTRTF